MVVLWPPTVHVIRKYRNIVIGGACNLRCDYCDLKDDRVDVPAVCAALDAIVSRFQPETVLLRVEADGEITLYPTILDHLELIAQRGYAIEVLSNARIGPAVVRRLEEHVERLVEFLPGGLHMAELEVCLPGPEVLIGERDQGGDWIFDRGLGKWRRLRRLRRSLGSAAGRVHRWRGVPDARPAGGNDGKQRAKTGKWRAKKHAAWH